MEKVGRNDPCPCGSGKKFKKCCEAKVSRRSIGSAQLISGGDSKMSSFFKSRVTPVAPPQPEAPKKEEPETPTDETHLNM